jgi:hypothetical protein
MVLYLTDDVYQCVTVPKEERDETAGQHAPGIDGIGDAAMEDDRPKPFKEGDPDREVEGDFPSPGRGIVRSQADDAVGEKVERKCHGYDQRIVEVPMKEGGISVEVGLDQGAIDKIDGKTGEEYRVAPISKGGALLNKHRG